MDLRFEITDGRRIQSCPATSNLERTARIIDVAGTGPATTLDGRLDMAGSTWPESPPGDVTRHMPKESDVIGCRPGGVGHPPAPRRRALRHRVLQPVRPAYRRPALHGRRAAPPWRRCAACRRHR